jgi:hypothetical protein
MRTKPFTFTKTKRVKVTTEHPAISIDLTKAEAANLRKLLGRTSGPGSMGLFSDLYEKLNEFAPDGDTISVRDVIFCEGRAEVTR